MMYKHELIARLLDLTTGAGFGLLLAIGVTVFAPRLKCTRSAVFFPALILLIGPLIIMWSAFAFQLVPGLVFGEAYAAQRSQEACRWLDLASSFLAWNCLVVASGMIASAQSNCHGLRSFILAWLPFFMSDVAMSMTHGLLSVSGYLLSLVIGCGASLVPVSRSTVNGIVLLSFSALIFLSAAVAYAYFATPWPLAPCLYKP